MKYAIESFIALAILLLFGIVGSMEILPAEKEQILASYRQGMEYKFEIAGRF